MLVAGLGHYWQYEYAGRTPVLSMGPEPEASKDANAKLQLSVYSLRFSPSPG